MYREAASQDGRHHSYESITKRCEGGSKLKEGSEIVLGDILEKLSKNCCEVRITLVGPRAEGVLMIL